MIHGPDPPKKQAKQKTINTIKKTNSNSKSNDIFILLQIAMNHNNTQKQLFMFDMKVDLHAISRHTTPPR